MEGEGRKPQHNAIVRSISPLAKTRNQTFGCFFYKLRVQQTESADQRISRVQSFLAQESWDTLANPRMDLASLPVSPRISAHHVLLNQPSFGAVFVPLRWIAVRRSEVVWSILVMFEDTDCKCHPHFMQAVLSLAKSVKGCRCRPCHHLP